MSHHIPSPSTDDGYRETIDEGAVKAFEHAKAFAEWLDCVGHCNVGCGQDTYDAWVSINDHYCSIAPNGDLKEPSGPWELLYGLYSDYGKDIAKIRQG